MNDAIGEANLLPVHRGGAKRLAGRIEKSREIESFEVDNPVLS